MTSYSITVKSSAQDLGTYEGATPQAAVEAMHRDAGYASTAAAAEALGVTVDALLADLETAEARTLYVVADSDRPAQARQVWAERPLDAAREVYGEHVTVGSRASGWWPVLAPHPFDGSHSTIGRVYLLNRRGEAPR